MLTGNKSVQDVGERILREVIRVASGKLTKNEILGHRELPSIGLPLLLDEDDLTIVSR